MTFSAAPAPARDGEALPANDQLQVQYRPIGEIRPSGKNPREHPRHQINKLKKSITRDGIVQPLIIDEQGEIIAGHAVFLAAKQLGFRELPTVTLYGLSETDKRRLRIALNKLGELSKFNTEVLKGEVLAILAEEPELDVEELGFEVAEMDVVLHADPDGDDDRIPTTRRAPGSSRRHLEGWRSPDRLWRCARRRFRAPGAGRCAR